MGKEFFEACEDIVGNIGSGNFSCLFNDGVEKVIGTGLNEFLVGAGFFIGFLFLIGIHANQLLLYFNLLAIVYQVREV